MRTATTRTNHLVFVSLGCLLALLIVVGAGCGKQENPAPSPGNAEPNTTPPAQSPSSPNDVSEAPAKPNTVVATVNGQPITEAELNAGIDYYMRNDPQASMLPPQYAVQIRSLFKPRVLDLLVGQTLLRQGAKAAGVEVSDEEVVATLEKTAAAQTPPLTIDQFKQMLEAQGGNFQEVVNDFREGLVLDKFMTEKFADQVNVTDANARAYYDENIADFNQPEVVKASHILLGYTNPDPNADRSADPNKAKIEELLAQIRDGADFGELASIYSIDLGSKARGGDLGYFPRGSMETAFENAAFALEPNQVSDVVETPYGFHIIKSTDHREGRVIPFDEVKDRIIDMLKQRERNVLVAKYVEELKAKAKIEYAAGDEPNAPPAMPATVTPAPITRTPRTPEPADANSALTVVEPNTN